MPFKAVTLDAYGTLLQNEDLTLIARHVVADHGLTVPIEDVHRFWIDLYYEATQVTPFRTLRALQADVFSRVLRRFEARGDATPYVEMFFEVTTKAQLYPETLKVLTALSHLPSAIVSNADHEHVSAWNFGWPVQLIIVSEAVRAYKPNRLVFESAVQQLGVSPHEVLHVGDSDVDDVKGAKAAGLQVAWINRNGRSLRPGVPRPDFELRDLTELPALF